MKNLSRVHVHQGEIGSGDGVRTRRTCYNAPFSAIIILAGTILWDVPDCRFCGLTKLTESACSVPGVPHTPMFQIPFAFAKERSDPRVVLCHTASQELRRRSRTWEVRKSGAKLT